MQSVSDLVASACLLHYDSLPPSLRPSVRSNGIPQYTILSGICLVSRSGSPDGTPNNEIECFCVALGAGSRCVPESRLPIHGDALHDSHAEILARRGAMRWFLEEIYRLEESEMYNSVWITKRLGELYYELRPDVTVHLYVSTLPCGDASMLSLSVSQDPTMAQMKAANPLPDHTPGSVIRGRNNYNALGVLRTKPGRADSDPTISMSCSDKIALWTLVGIQGALGTAMIRPVYLDSIVVGDVPLEMLDATKAECQRAFCERLKNVDGLAHPFIAYTPRVEFTSLTFSDSRTQMPDNAVSCPESLCWVAGTTEIIVNGLKRGIAEKRRLQAGKRPRLCKLSMLELYSKIQSLRFPSSELDFNVTYYETKQGVEAYQQAKRALRAQDGPLWGWVVSGKEWEDFSIYCVENIVSAQAHEREAQHRANTASK